MAPPDHASTSKRATVSEPRWGLTLPLANLPLADQEPLIRRVEALGYDDLWTGEATGHDGFTPLALAAAWTERMRLGTGVVSVFTRGPAVLAQCAAALADASRGRFILGVGSSSDRIVERWNGIPFERPLSRVREVVQQLRAVLSGERGPGGFKLDVPPAVPIPIYVAALRAKMLQTAGELADGAWVNFVPLSGLPRLIDEIRAGELRAGKDPGSVDVVCRVMNLAMPADEGVEAIRPLFAGYATVPVYTEFFRWLGWGEQIDPVVEAWNADDRRRAAELVPEELIREVVVFGSAEEQRRRLAAYANAGVASFSLTPLGPPGAVDALIDGLAPAPAGVPSR
jgi:probable F420-dependent oxidoreductase